MIPSAAPSTSNYARDTIQCNVSRLSLGLFLGIVCEK